MSDLTDFLLARIAEDEANANDPYWNMADEGTMTTSRLLAECDAKRRIVAQAIIYRRDAEAERPGMRRTVGIQLAEVAEDAVRSLAGAYADHTQYREEWKP